MIEIKLEEKYLVSQIRKRYRLEKAVSFLSERGSKEFKLFSEWIWLGQITDSSGIENVRLIVWDFLSFCCGYLSWRTGSKAVFYLYFGMFL